MVALPLEDWPEAWKEVVPCLDRRLRIGDHRYQPLRPKTRAAVIQAVGMCALARDWAASRGAPIKAEFNGELADVFQRFLLNEREIRAGSAADYFERVLMFARRAGLLEGDAEAAWADHIGALRALGDGDEPTKLEAIRRFQKAFTLASILHKAEDHMEAALALPAHLEQARRLRRKAVVFVLLVNGADRQGDLSSMRIGHGIHRNPDGTWEHPLRQQKTGNRKEIGALWDVTCRILDAHVLAGRPLWQMADRLAEFDGKNLVSLEDEAFDTYHPSALLGEDFGISGHLTRTLIRNAIRKHRPDAAWAAKEMLGHSTRWIQASYLLDFRMMLSIRSWHETLEDILAAGQG